ncbi:type II toxin-antitoxin system VapB family antitoxin [Caulobacter segnis]|uniref:Transcription factor n=1 Tax=Caulobacter segnis TaxID=88688 RepID=A0A2W5XCM1_9CAUL|nr:type II toxin-antitoxin system VapB family antitoxin [Caulobacter segnis]PZR35151.1 MAG: transcription factor [Caulobacter segnis]
MGIFIKNPETEKLVREIATLRGTTITSTIDALAREALARERQTPKRLSVAELQALTDRVVTPAARAGLLAPITKTDFDEINDLPGLPTA